MKAILTGHAVFMWNKLFCDVADAAHVSVKRRRVKSTQVPWMSSITLAKQCKIATTIIAKP
jgi:hypothetical protein